MIVDHTLRPESAAEAALTAARIAQRGIAACVLRLDGLRHGPGLAARARATRYAALEAACAERGIVHLLLGHHAADQAETILLRQGAGSGPDGLAGMAEIVERRNIRLLRPLLTIEPQRLRARLQAEAMAWVEDPSNADRKAARARARQTLTADPSAAAALRAQAKTSATARADSETASAEQLADRAALYPEGYAILSAGPLMPVALGALLRVIGGADFSPASAALAGLAAAPRPATLGGVRLLPAGRLGSAGALLLVRERLAAPVPATPGALWDGRFRVCGDLPTGTTIGPLGADATRLRGRSLPHAIARVLPAFRMAGTLVAVPHLQYRDAVVSAGVHVVFSPLAPVCGAGFHAGAAWLRVDQAKMNAP